MAGSVSAPAPPSVLRALVLGLGVNGYGLVRGLARAGVPVTGLYRKTDEFGRLSRYCERAIPVAADGDDEGLVSGILAAAGQERAALFPTDDRYVFMLDRHADRLAPRFAFHRMAPGALAAIVDKAEMARLCRQAGVLSPETHVPEAGEPLERRAREFLYPCLVKPRRSFGTHFPPDLKNFVADTPAALLRFHVEHPDLAGETIWQEIIPGGDETIFQLNALRGADGALAGAVCVRKLRQYPPGYGIMSYGRTEDNAEVATAAVRLLTSLDYRGLASAEFKQDPRTGRLYFIELNARLPWYNSLFPAAGVNLVALAYRDLGGSIALPAGDGPAQANRYWLGFREDLGAFARAGKRSPGALGRWLGSLVRARAFAWWEWRDPRPFLRAGATRVGSLLRGVTGRGRPERVEAKPIRVMHVVTVLSLSGMEHGVIKQVNRLDYARFAPSICCLGFQREETRGILDPRVPVHELRKAAGRDLGIIRRLASLFRRERVDIVHSHNWQTFFYTVAAAALAGIPLRVHGHHGREAAAASARQARLSRWLAGRVSRLVAVSGDLGRELIEEWGVPAERVSVIPNGVDLDGFAHPGPVEAAREEIGLAPEHRVIMSVGGLRPVKDYPTMIRAFARVHAARPEARLVIVGGERGGGRQSELEALAGSLGVASSVLFPGVRQDIARLLTLSDVYVNSSLFEGMSNTILEAMAASRPVVATRVGGNPELVRDGMTGYLVPPGDETALAARLIEVLADPGLAKALGAAGRAMVESEHAMGRMVAAYEDCYEDLAERRALRHAARVRERAKAVVARVLSVPGLSRRDRGHRLVVLTYHRVLPVRAALGYALPPMAMPQDEFDAQMAHLARGYAPLPLGEAADRLARGTLPPRAVSVTFDDGYVDNYDHAFPLLRKHGIPASIFVVTGALDRRTPFWWDVVARAVARLAEGEVRDARELPTWLAARLDLLGARGGPREVARGIVHTLNHLERAERGVALAALLAAAPPETAGADGLLTWDQVREMRRGGVEFGSHTVSHAFLDELPLAEARREIEDSLERLAAELGEPSRLFAYPRGRVAEPIRAILRAAGVTVAVTTELGENRGGHDLLALRRLDAGYLRRVAGFDPHVFDAELAGRFERLHAVGRRGDR